MLNNVDIVLLRIALVAMTVTTTGERRISSTKLIKTSKPSELYIGWFSKMGVP